MTITKKEIKTEIHVEISREEFCDNYQAMMCDIIEKRWSGKRRFYQRFKKAGECP